MSTPRKIEHTQSRCPKSVDNVAKFRSPGVGRIRFSITPSTGASSSSLLTRPAASFKDEMRLDRHACATPWNLPSRFTGGVMSTRVHELVQALDDLKTV
jgi:hypothetical protein